MFCTFYVCKVCVLYLWWILFIHKYTPIIIYNYIIISCRDDDVEYICVVYIMMKKKKIFLFY